MTKTFQKINSEAFYIKLNKINKKLGKYGQEISILSTSERIIKNEETGKATILVDIELSGPQVLHNGKNVTYVGVVSFKDGIKQIFSNDETICLGDIPDSNLVCDHCHINRYRVKYFFFKEEGKLVSIGSSCAVDYFGMDVERYLDVFTASMNDLDSEFGTGSKYYDMDSLQKVLNAVYATTNGFKGYWVSKDKAEVNGNVSTSSAIKGLLNPPRAPYGKEEREIMQNAETEIGDKTPELLKKVAEKWNINPSNDFEHNIVNNLFYNDEEGKRELREFVISPGIVGYAIYAALATPESKEKINSEWIGTIGEKILTIVKVVDRKIIDSIYGQTTLVSMRDENGHSFKTFTTSVASGWEIGRTLNIKGTVKAHNEYKGVKETLLKLVKEVK
jgi:hypothetical protein